MLVVHQAINIYNIYHHQKVQHMALTNHVIGENRPNPSPSHSLSCRYSFPYLDSLLPSTYDMFTCAQLCLLKFLCIHFQPLSSHTATSRSCQSHHSLASAASTCHDNFGLTFSCVLQTAASTQACYFVQHHTPFVQDHLQACLRPSDVGIQWFEKGYLCCCC